MSSVFFDPTFSDDIRRQALFRGHLLVYSPRPSTLALCSFARELIREAFKPLQPEEAQHALPVEQYAAILAQLKPLFINHPESKRHLQQILTELGCDPEKSYFDVPRMRTATSGGYLTTGIAYAWHPHRDTWYSAPMCQLNWWIPVLELHPDNAMAFHPQYWTQPVANDSRQYNYYEWNRHHRPAASQYLKEDPRPLPRPTEPVQVQPQIRLLPPVGGIIIFSAAQMHSTVPNTSGVTRFSIDFRTVHLEDVTAKAGAPNIDGACTGTSLRDFLRVADQARISEDVIRLYDDGTESAGDLVYRATEVEAAKARS
jgi:hypothetical protein